MIAIIDYKSGNLGSVANMIKKIGSKCRITNDIQEILDSEKIILPGVGSFDRAMNNLKEYNLIDILNKKALIDKTPFLGICLGMQLFAETSEEGILPGLEWIRGRVVKFSFTENDKKLLKIPHMGWNHIHIEKNSSMLKNVTTESRYYFVHSFHFVCKDQDDILARTNYGFPFVSAVEHENIVGVQFHPEKSHKYGMAILENFIKSF
jgi:glutamine amidotransferase